MLAAGFPLVAFLQIVRVYVQSLRRIADAEVRLFHLYVHEPMIRDALPELEIAEEMGEMAADILPLAAPLTEYLHTRYLRYFLEQDVVGHMETDLDGAALRARPGPGHALLHRPHRLHPLHRGGGRAEALDVVENFVETVEATLPPEATVVKTIGDEVMVVSPDTDLAHRVGGRPARPLPRAAAAAGRRSTTANAVYRDGDYFGTQVNLAHRVVGRAQAGEVLVTDAVTGSLSRARPDLRRRSARST